MVLRTLKLKILIRYLYSCIHYIILYLKKYLFLLNQEKIIITFRVNR